VIGHTSLEQGAILEHGARKRINNNNNHNHNNNNNNNNDNNNNNNNNNKKNEADIQPSLLNKLGQ